jgi:hypothetical protein
MLQLVKDTSNEIEQFLKFIYGDQEGYVHLGFRDYEKFKDEKKIRLEESLSTIPLGTH